MLITMPLSMPKSSVPMAVIEPASGNGISELARMLASEYSIITAGSEGSKVKPSTVIVLFDAISARMRRSMWYSMVV